MIAEEKLERWYKSLRDRKPGPNVQPCCGQTQHMAIIQDSHDRVAAVCRECRTLHRYMYCDTGSIGLFGYPIGG